MAEKPVYSTLTGSAKASGPAKAGPRFKPASGPAKMRLETKGRGGKTVTVLFNLPLPDEEAVRALMRELQATLGCGATFKDQAIELRGDLRDRVEACLKDKGIRLVRAGG